MKVLVDRSVWSLALRRKVVRPGPKVQTLRDLISAEHSVFLTGIILQEITQGVRNEAQLAQLVRYLEPFVLLQPDRGTYLQAAGLFSRCRDQGTPVATIDCLIAATAIHFECALLTDDKDFNKLASVSRLKLL